MTIQLYPDQQRGLDMLRASFRGGKMRPILQAPTGWGKTVVAGEIIKRALDKGKRTCFIVDRIQLVNQASAHLTEIGIDHGVIQANHEMTNYSKPVQVASIQTLARRRRPDFDLGIIDEAHIRFKEHIKMMDEWDNVPFVGLSATPWAKGLGLTYDDLIIPTSYEELISLGRLAPPKFYAPDIPNLDKVKVSKGDYIERELSKIMQDHKLIANIVDTWHKLAYGKQTLVFAVDIAHSKNLRNRFADAGVNAAHIDAYTNPDYYTEVIEKFKNNEITMLCSVGKLTTGFDAPNAQCLICARPTKSLMLWIQMIGRILRRFDGKEYGLVLDHTGNYLRLGGPLGNDFPTNLDKTPPSERQPPIKREKLPKICTSCGVQKDTHKCPECGFAPEKITDIAEAKGRLIEVKAAYKKDSNQDKKDLYEGLLFIQQKKDKPEWWARYIYEKKYGVNPEYGSYQARETEKAKNYIKHLAIKKSYRK